MHDHTDNPTSTAPPRRDGFTGWMIVLFVIISLVAAVGIFALRGFFHAMHAMQKDMFVAYVASHNMVEVKKGLNADPSLVNIVGTFEISPLGAAAGDGDLAMMKLLIARKADVNGRAHAGYTPLHEAALYNQTEAAKLLLAKGAKIDATTDSECSPLHLAALMGKKGVAEVLIANGADVNAKEHNGLTPLHFAAINGHTNVAEVLVAHEANVNAKAIDGSTPLKNALKQLAELKQLSPNVIKARKAQIEQDRKQGRPFFDSPTPERCRQVIYFLRQHGGKE